jgi:hypothetical protein
MSSNGGAGLAKTSVTVRGPSSSVRRANSYKMHTHHGKKVFSSEGSTYNSPCEGVEGCTEELKL